MLSLCVLVSAVGCQRIGFALDSRNVGDWSRLVVDDASACLALLHMISFEIKTRKQI